MRGSLTIAPWNVGLHGEGAVTTARSLISYGAHLDPRFVARTATLSGVYDGSAGKVSRTLACGSHDMSRYLIPRSANICPGENDAGTVVTLASTNTSVQSDCAILHCVGVQVATQTFRTRGQLIMLRRI